MLRRHFGISAHEARHEMPAWERQLLIEEFVEEKKREAAAHGDRR